MVLAYIGAEGPDLERPYSDFTDLRGIVGGPGDKHRSMFKLLTLNVHDIAILCGSDGYHC